MSLSSAPLTRERIAEAVARAWRRVLDPGSLSSDDAFDSAGGDSLGFLRLVHLIEEDLDIALPLDALSLMDTPTGLIAAIQDACAGVGAGAAFRPKVFMVPVAGGDAPGQARFRAGCAAALDIEPVQLPHWTTIIAPSFTFGSVCTDVIRQIEAKVPSGPILLAGYCFGGAVASAVARQLHEQGRTVAFLGILDGDITWFRRQPTTEIQSISGLERLKSMRWAWQQGRLTEHLAWLTAQTLEQRGRGLLRWLARNGRYRRLPSTFGFYLNRYLQMALLPRVDRPGLTRTMRADRPAPIPTAVFRTVYHGPDRPEDLGWSELFRPVSATIVKGDHDGVFALEAIDELCAAFVRSVGAPPPLVYEPGRNPVATT